jgi:hypothetical protein
MEFNTTNNHLFNNLRLDFQTVIRALMDSQSRPLDYITNLPLELQDTLMDYLFEDERFDTRGVCPEEFPDLLFGARPGDVHNIELKDILDYNWELTGNIRSIKALIAEGCPVVVLSPNLVYLGNRR